MTLALRPLVVCVDSPSGWSLSGSSRLAERELARIGIQSYRTGPDPGEHPFYGWMRVGFEIFQRLSATYPRYRGGEVAGTAAEVFPHATASLLAGRLRPAGVPKEEFRRAVLRDAGVAEQQLGTLDEVDAALAALTGLIAIEGGHCAVGEADEGVILLPISRVPVVPLPQGPHQADVASAAHPRTRSRRSGNTAAEARQPTPETSAPTTFLDAGARRRRAQTMTSLDFRAAATFIATVPAGSWTSYKDVATAAGNERGAQAVGEWLRRHGHHVVHVHRIIRSSGLVAEGFRATGPGVPADAPSARELLMREGVRFDVHGRADQQQRVQPRQTHEPSPRFPGSSPRVAT